MLNHISKFGNNTFLYYDIATNNRLLSVVQARGLAVLPDAPTPASSPASPASTPASSPAAASPDVPADAPATVPSSSHAGGIFRDLEVDNSVLSTIKGFENLLALDGILNTANSQFPSFISADSFVRQHTTLMGSVGNLMFQYMGDTLVSKFVKPIKPGTNKVEFGFADNISIVNLDLLNCHNNPFGTSIIQLNTNGFLGINHIGITTQGNLGTTAYYALLNAVKKDSSAAIDLSKAWSNSGIQISSKILGRFISANQVFQLEHADNSKIIMKFDLYNSSTELVKTNIYVSDVNVKFTWGAGIKARYKYEDSGADVGGDSWSNLLSYPVFFNLSGRLTFGFNNCIVSPHSIMKMVTG